MSPAPELDCLVIADDLTGACDAAVQFALCGRPTSVMLAMDAPPAGATVIAVSTESRHLDESAAARLIEQVANWFTARIVFKKIDSVLRGSPGAEIAAALDAFRCEAAVATPAFPAMGRFVNSANAADVARTLRSDAHVEPHAVAEALSSGARVVTASSVSDADLDAVVAGGIASRRRILWAGSGGLAAALARHWGGSPELRISPLPTSLIFCIGSDHPVTLQQIARLRDAKPDAVVLPAGPIPDCGALLLSGGDTASAICRAAETRRIDLYGELLPGIPWGILRCGRLDGIPVVTKSGGFGAPDALIRVAEFFQ